MSSFFTEASSPQAYHLNDECILCSSLSPGGGFLTAFISWSSRRCKGSGLCAYEDEDEDIDLLYTLSVLVNHNGSTILGPWALNKEKQEEDVAPAGSGFWALFQGRSQDRADIPAVSPLASSASYSCKRASTGRTGQTGRDGVTLIWSPDSTGIYVCLPKYIVYLNLQWQSTSSQGDVIIENIERFIVVESSSNLLKPDLATTSREKAKLTSIPPAASMKDRNRSKGDAAGLNISLLSPARDSFVVDNNNGGGGGGVRVQLQIRLQSEVMDLKYRCLGNMIYVESDNCIIFCNCNNEIYKVRWLPDASIESFCIFSFNNVKEDSSSNGGSSSSSSKGQMKTFTVDIEAFNRGMNVSYDKVDEDLDPNIIRSDDDIFSLCGFDDELKTLFLLCKSGIMHCVSYQMIPKDESADESYYVIEESQQPTRVFNSNIFSLFLSNTRFLEFKIVSNSSASSNRALGTMGLLFVAVVESLDPISRRISTDSSSISLVLFNLFRTTEGGDELGNFNNYEIISSADISASYSPGQTSLWIFSNSDNVNLNWTAKATSQSPSLSPSSSSSSPLPPSPHLAFDLRGSYCCTLNASSLVLTIRPLSELSQIVFQMDFSLEIIFKEPISDSTSSIFYNISCNREKFLLFFSRIKNEIKGSNLEKNLESSGGSRASDELCKESSYTSSLPEPPDTFTGTGASTSASIQDEKSITGYSEDAAAEMDDDKRLLVESRTFEISLKISCDGDQSNSLAYSIDSNNSNFQINIHEALACKNKNNTAVDGSKIEFESKHGSHGGPLEEVTIGDIEGAISDDLGLHSTIQGEHPPSPVQGSTLHHKDYFYRYLLRRYSISFSCIFNLPQIFVDFIRLGNEGNSNSYSNSNTSSNSELIFAAESGKCQVLTGRRKGLSSKAACITSNYVAILTKARSPEDVAAFSSSFGDDLVLLLIYNKLTRRHRVLSLSSLTDNESSDIKRSKTSSHVVKSKGKLVEPISLLQPNDKNGDSLQTLRNACSSRILKRNVNAESLPEEVADYLSEAGLLPDADSTIGPISSTNGVLFCSDDTLLVFSSRRSSYCLEIVSRTLTRGNRNKNVNFSLHKTISLAQKLKLSSSASLTSHCMVVDRTLVPCLLMGKNESFGNYFSLFSKPTHINDSVYVVSISDGDISSCYLIVPILVAKNENQNPSINTCDHAIIDYDVVTLWSTSMCDFSIATNEKSIDKRSYINNENKFSSRSSLKATRVILIKDSSNPFIPTSDETLPEESSRVKEASRSSINILFVTLDVFGTVRLFDPILLSCCELGKNVASIDVDFLFPKIVDEAVDINEVGAEAEVVKNDAILHEISSMFLVMMSRDSMSPQGACNSSKFTRNVSYSANIDDFDVDVSSRPCSSFSGSAESSSSEYNSYSKAGNGRNDSCMWIPGLIGLSRFHLNGDDNINSRGGIAMAADVDTISRFISCSKIALPGLNAYQSYKSANNGILSVIEYVPLLKSAFASSGLSCGSSFKMCEFSIHFAVFMFIVNEICRLRCIVDILSSKSDTDSSSTSANGSSSRRECISKKNCGLFEEKISNLTLFAISMFKCLTEGRPSFQNNEDVSYSSFRIKSLLKPLIENVEYRIRDIVEGNSRVSTGLGLGLGLGLHSHTGSEYCVIMSILYSMRYIEGNTDACNNKGNIALPSVMMEVLSLLLRKLEPSTSKHLFPIPIDPLVLNSYGGLSSLRMGGGTNETAKAKTKDTDISKLTPLSIFEESLFTMDLNRSVRMLTPACDFLGGPTSGDNSNSQPGHEDSNPNYNPNPNISGPNISHPNSNPGSCDRNDTYCSDNNFSRGGLLMSLILSFEVLHNSFQTASLRNLVECFDFIHRLESILKCISEGESKSLSSEVNVSSVVYDQSFDLSISHEFSRHTSTITSSYSRRVAAAVVDGCDDNNYSSSGSSNKNRNCSVSANNSNTCNNSAGDSSKDIDTASGSNLGGALLDIAFSIMGLITYPFYTTYDIITTDPDVILAEAARNGGVDDTIAASTQLKLESEKHGLGNKSENKTCLTEGNKLSAGGNNNNNNDNNNCNSSYFINGNNLESQLISVIDHAYTYKIYDSCALMMQIQSSKKGKSRGSNISQSGDDRFKPLMERQFLQLQAFSKQEVVSESIYYVLMQAQFLFAKRSYFGVALLFLSMKASSNFKHSIRYIIRENLSGRSKVEPEPLDVNYDSSIANYIDVCVSKFVVLGNNRSKNSIKKAILLNSDKAFDMSSSDQSFAVCNAFLDIIYTLSIDFEDSKNGPISGSKTGLSSGLKPNPFLEIYQHDAIQSKQSVGRSSSKSLVFEKAFDEIYFDHITCNYLYNKNLEAAFRDKSVSSLSCTGTNGDSGIDGDAFGNYELYGIFHKNFSHAHTTTLSDKSQVTHINRLVSFEFPDFLHQKEGISMASLLKSIALFCIVTKKYSLFLVIYFQYFLSTPIRSIEVDDINEITKFLLEDS